MKIHMLGRHPKYVYWINDYWNYCQYTVQIFFSLLQGVITLSLLHATPSLPSSFLKWLEKKEWWIGGHFLFLSRKPLQTSTDVCGSPRPLQVTVTGLEIWVTHMWRFGSIFRELPIPRQASGLDALESPVHIQKWNLLSGTQWQQQLITHKIPQDQPTSKEFGARKASALQTKISGCELQGDSALDRELQFA